MPRTEVSVSYTMLRNYTELFQWRDPATGLQRKGFNPPPAIAGQKDTVKRVPFYVKFVTQDGRVDEGVVTCVSVQPERLQRKIRFVESGEIRVIYDYLVVEVDGVKFYTH